MTDVEATRTKTSEKVNAQPILTDLEKNPEVMALKGKLNGLLESEKGLIIKTIFYDTQRTPFFHQNGHLNGTWKVSKGHNLGEAECAAQNVARLAELDGAPNPLRDIERVLHKVAVNSGCTEMLEAVEKAAYYSTWNAAWAAVSSEAWSERAPNAAGDAAQKATSGGAWSERAMTAVEDVSRYEALLAGYMVMKDKLDPEYRKEAWPLLKECSEVLQNGFGLAGVRYDKERGEYVLYVFAKIPADLRT